MLVEERFIISQLGLHSCSILGPSVGLPFEHMTEEVGRDIGGKIGRVIKVDKRSWQADQAKFMQVRVDLPIEKPIRRGGYVTNMDGERCWVSFKHER